MSQLDEEINSTILKAKSGGNLAELKGLLEDISGKLKGLTIED